MKKQIAQWYKQYNVINIYLKYINTKTQYNILFPNIYTHML